MARVAFDPIAESELSITGLAKKAMQKEKLLAKSENIRYKLTITREEAAMDLTKILIGAGVIMVLLVFANWYFRVRPLQTKKTPGPAKSTDPIAIATALGHEERTALERLGRSTTGRSIELHVFERYFAMNRLSAESAQSTLTSLVRRGCATKGSKGYNLTNLGRKVYAVTAERPKHAAM